MDESGAGASPEPLHRHLYRRAAVRWLGLAIACVLLAILWTFAGQVREPGAVKRPWAVTASRGLVIAGALLTARLLLFSGEQRIPVLFLPASGDPSDTMRGLAVAAALGAKGYAAVPMMDVVRFIRERRYVPGKCFGLAVEVDSLESLAAVAADSVRLPITAVLRPESLRKETVATALPENVSLAVRVEVGPDAAAELRRLAAAAQARLGKGCEYALATGGSEADRRQLVRASGYVGLLDGMGYNRFGDESHLVRIMDMSHTLTQNHPIPGLRLWIALYKGVYAVWPALVMGRGFGALKAGEQAK